MAELKLPLNIRKMIYHQSHKMMTCDEIMNKGERCTNAFMYKIPTKLFSKPEEIKYLIRDCSEYCLEHIIKTILHGDIKLIYKDEDNNDVIEDIKSHIDPESIVIELFNMNKDSPLIGEIEFKNNNKIEYLIVDNGETVDEYVKPFNMDLMVKFINDMKPTNIVFKIGLNFISDKYSDINFKILIGVLKGWKIVKTKNRMSRKIGITFRGELELKNLKYTES